MTPEFYYLEKVKTDYFLHQNPFFYVLTEKTT